MGFLDFLVGGSDVSRIEKYKKRKDARKIVQYLKSGDADVKKKAIEVLVELVDSKALTETDEKAVLDILDPMIRIRDRRRVDKIDNPHELVKMAIHEFMKKRDLNMAIYTLKRAHEMRPDDLSIMNNLAAAYSRDNLFEQAQEIWEGILRKDPKESTAIENYSTALYLQGEKIIRNKAKKEKHAQGADYLIKSLEFNPNYTDSMLILADYYMSIKSYDKTIYYYKKCLNNSRLPTVYRSVSEMRGYVCRMMADAFREDNNSEQALDYYRQSLSVYMWDESEKIRIKDIIKELG
ncbi:MAG: tetratricopeptide repeat protein [Candidatus Eremiobacteraeota bacterium]|nr:tetratricopeptide repeat protein [Candidatus Eremiobacteraeota bacterium]